MMAKPFAAMSLLFAQCCPRCDLLGTCVYVFDQRLNAPKGKVGNLSPERSDFFNEILRRSRSNLQNILSGVQFLRNKLTDKTYVLESTDTLKYLLGNLTSSNPFY